MNKPLGYKNYGSIPHLPNSRLGPGDHSCHEGQARIATVKTRDKHDRVIVTEKLDGSNVGVARIGNTIHALGRAGYPASSSPYEQHRMFHDWVLTKNDRFMHVLEPGERIVGEWLAQAHGTRYDLNHEPFVAFDMFADNVRLPYDTMRQRIDDYFTMAQVIHDGLSISVEDVMASMGTHGFHGALDPAEGAVWRVERQGRVLFMVKYVMPDKVDGCYLPEISGRDPVWNWHD